MNGYGSNQLNGYGASETQNWNNDNRNLNGYGPSQGQNLDENGNPKLNGYGYGPSQTNTGQNFDTRNQNSNGYGRKKRSPKPCNGNGQPTGQSTNNLPTQQLPQQQQPQQIPPGGVNINNLQRDQQNARVRRSVQDPDKVLPGASNDEKNLFDRIIEVAKEVVARVTRWANENEKEIAAADTKITPNVPEKPKL